MIKLIIGHRGVGKTSLMSRLKEYQPHCQIYDLDKYIEHKNCITVSDIFSLRANNVKGNMRIKSFEINDWVAVYEVGEVK